ncbi:TPA: hypothetical protein QDZ75_003698 [Stenotrophomonas maltophilia]|uniref:hypothetical protein n=1 Tax=Stenotrophomonas maltophilia TaxID=40324 RepID=UPI000C25FD3B|nr:hypothetical protein [Stenotrophomonas maltophilia]MCO7469468.1 hypothetical protein [Stenotrophomonas maltophilia]PJL44705.1 hypothetical protein B9Y56_08450 [Stenotrophomonas maltophilia]HDS1139627.1 hypothetical protein [Stenotrophomonas maltophilia]
MSVRVGNFEIQTVETRSLSNGSEWRSTVFVHRVGQAQALEMLAEVGRGDTWLQAREAALVLGREFAASLDPDDSIDARKPRLTL